MDSSVPPLVTFSVDRAGEPQTATDGGPYAAITGCFEKGGKEHPVAQYGWPGAKNKCGFSSRAAVRRVAYGKRVYPCGRRLSP